MKARLGWFSGVVLACALIVVGCGKSSAPKQAGVDINGVNVDLPKLQASLATVNSPDIRNNMQQVAFGIRYGDYVKAMMSLEKISQDASLTDEQKKMVNEVMEQMKQVVAKTPSKPTQ